MDGESLKRGHSFWVSVVPQARWCVEDWSSTGGNVFTTPALSWRDFCHCLKTFWLSIAGESDIPVIWSTEDRDIPHKPGPMAKKYLTLNDASDKAENSVAKGGAFPFNSGHTCKGTAAVACRRYLSTTSTRVCVDSLYLVFLQDN